MWLHLQQLLAAHPSAIGRVTPPNMHAVLPLARTRAQFAAHAAALALLLAGLALPALLRPAALLWLLSFALLGLNLLAATRIYLDGRRRISAPGAGAPSA